MDALRAGTLQSRCAQMFPWQWAEWSPSMPPLSLLSAVPRDNYLLSSSSGLSFTLRWLIINQMHLKINLAILRLIGMLISSVQQGWYGNNLRCSELLTEVNAWGHLLSCEVKNKTLSGNKSSPRPLCNSEKVWSAFCFANIRNISLIWSCPTKNRWTNLKKHPHSWFISV